MIDCIGARDILLMVWGMVMDVRGYYVEHSTILTYHETSKALGANVAHIIIDIMNLMPI